MDLEEKLETKGKCMWEIKLCGWYLMSKVLDTDHLLWCWLIFSPSFLMVVPYIFIGLKYNRLKLNLTWSFPSIHSTGKYLNPFWTTLGTWRSLNPRCNALRQPHALVIPHSHALLVPCSPALVVQRSQTTSRSGHPSLSCSHRPSLSCSRPTVSDDLTLSSSLTLMLLDDLTLSSSLPLDCRSRGISDSHHCNSQ